MRTASVATATVSELLELARSVEQSVPADLAQARACLHALDHALGHEDRGIDAVSTSRSHRDEPARRLRSMIAQVTDDVMGGHVVSVTGLEREVKRYLLRTRP